MKHVLLVISLFLSSVASAAEQLPVLLPLKGTVIDEYKQEVRNSKVQVVSAPAPVQMPEWKNGVQLYETAEANCSAGCVTITGGNVGQWNGSRSVAVKSVESKASSTLSAVTMEKIRKEPLPAVSAVTTKQMALRRVAASV